MAIGDSYILDPTELMRANYEKYKDNFVDSNKELVNSETFINLLVAEMTNQDPLEPTSNTEFITQMAQFSQLQYAQDSSKYSMATYASSLVGKTVTASKLEGKEYITKTGVVEQVIKNGDSYTVLIDGTSFSLSNINSVSSDNSGFFEGTTGSALGDTIARASMMVGMWATVNAKTESGDVLDAGVITSIEVRNGVVNVIINGVAYHIDDIVELTYAIYDDGTEGGDTDAAPGVDGDEETPGVDGDEDGNVEGGETVPDVDGDEVIPDGDEEDVPTEVREQLAADRFVDDVQDLEDI